MMEETSSIITYCKQMFCLCADGYSKMHITHLCLIKYNYMSLYTDTVYNSHIYIYLHLIYHGCQVSNLPVPPLFLVPVAPPVPNLPTCCQRRHFRRSPRSPDSTSQRRPPRWRKWRILVKHLQNDGHLLCLSMFHDVSSMKTSGGLVISLPEEWTSRRDMFSIFLVLWNRMLISAGW